MIKRLTILVALALGLVASIGADIPWPTCLPCPPEKPGQPPASMQ
jgi:hypothetical protein